MRPLKLEIEGFTAFRDRVELDLRTLDLFAITGPTGAGKSSLIDAICYALYGRVPRVANEIKDCISQGLNRMCVTLEFAAGNERYRVFRETRRQGQPNVRLERLLEDEWHPIGQRAAEVTGRIERIVGLSYDAFTRSVLLPQGQFQEFLSGSPDKRRDVLQSLLRLDVYRRMQSRANEIASQYKARIDQIDKELNEYLREATPENLERREDDLEAAKAESSTLAEKIEHWRQALSLSQAFNSSVDAHRKAKAEYETLARTVEVARNLAREGDAALQNLQDELDRLDREIAQNQFDDELFASLTAGATIAAAAESARRRLTEAQTTAKAKQAAQATTDKAHAEAQTSLTVAVEALDIAQHAFMEAQRQNLAAALQADLASGDTCPVCGGPVTQLIVIAAPNFDSARLRLEHAKTDHEAAQKSITAAVTRKATAEAELKAARNAITESQARVEDESQKLAGALPDFEDRSLALIIRALDAQKSARVERQHLLRKREEAVATLDKSRRALAEARESLAAQQQLLTTQKDSLSATERAATEAGMALTAAATQYSLTLLLEALQRKDDPGPVSQSELLRISSRREAVQQEIGRLEALIDRLHDDIEKAQRLRNEMTEVRAEYDVTYDLAQMLQANRFQSFLQGEALRMLANEGSRRLQELSGGRYRLDISPTGQDFEAIDQWNADERRSVRTLSGGETFLASLALALALAESLPSLSTDRRVVLDAIFLDEGFGSLDPEALDRAAEALDSLRDGSRMICVVTHLQDLAHRMPARIIVEKSETGSRAAIAS